MQKRAENEVIEHFIEFCWLDCPDVADSCRQNRYSATKTVQGTGDCHDLCIISITVRRCRQKKKI